MRAAQLHQDAIGWFGLMTGHASMLWAPLQQERFEKLGVLNTGERWLSMLLKRLMMTSWDMWSDRNDIKHGGHTLSVLPASFLESRSPLVLLLEIIFVWVVIEYSTTTPS